MIQCVISSYCSNVCKPITKSLLNLPLQTHIRYDALNVVLLGAYRDSNNCADCILPAVFFGHSGAAPVCFSHKKSLRTLLSN